MLVFLLDCLHFNKLLKLHQTEGRISSNLLKRKQSSRKTSIVCHWLKIELSIVLEEFQYFSRFFIFQDSTSFVFLFRDF